MAKLLIKNGSIVDGSGKAPYQADLLAVDGKIAAIAPDIPCTGVDEVVDARGYVVAPGIIDPHTHADLVIVDEDRQRASALCQGITTEVVGLCGLGHVPLPREQMIQSMRFNRGLFGCKEAYEAYDFSSFESYMGLVDGAGVNIAVFAAHNAARVAVSGFERETDIDKLCGVLRDAMQAGCIGVSTGLSYYPCAFADFQELEAICRVMREYDGVFLSHIRYPYAEAPYGALEEFIRLGKATGARIHILHYRTKYPLDAGKPEILLNMFREANRNGADITLETCPYISGSTIIHAILPDWVMEGGLESALGRLKDPALRGRITEEMQRLLKMTVCGNGKPARFGHVGGYPEYGGMLIQDVMERRGQSLDDLLIDLMIDSEFDVNYVGNESGEDPVAAKLLYNDIMRLLMDPLYLVGSDAMPYGEYVHPRTYGCYAKVLRLSGQYDIPIEKIIKKITADPAKRLRLADRGVLETGKAADMIVFKPEEICDRANFENPSLYASGMRYVFVNGVKALENEKPTAVFAGKTLKRQP